MSEKLETKQVKQQDITVTLNIFQKLKYTFTFYISR